MTTKYEPQKLNTFIERGFKLVSGDTDTLFGSNFIYINTNV